VNSTSRAALLHARLVERGLLHTFTHPFAATI